MDTKYGFVISQEAWDENINRLTNQLWKLIPMREHEEDWQSQLNTVLIELIGLQEILTASNKFVVLLSKLEGLREAEVEFSIYRKTVFESISLLRELVK